MSSTWFLFISYLNVLSFADGYPVSMISAGPTYSSYRFNALEHLTAISPYFESNSNSDGLSPDPPLGCTVDKAVYQVRHGSIYANEYDYVHTIEPFLKRLKESSAVADFSNDPNLAFIPLWTSPLSNSEEQVSELAKFGFFEAFSLGNRLAHRYPHLMPEENDKFFKIWVSDSKRTRRSAEALFTGLYGGHDEVGKISVISEDNDRGADTLTPTKTCPKFDVSKGLKQAVIWLRNYTVPIVARLNTYVSGFQFTVDDVLAMQELCGYETVIRGSSPFCRVFTPDEWLSFEYYFDIKYYYELGYGNPLSANLGMPWVLATSDLLSQIDDKSQHLYISVAHRQLAPLIITALGLLNDSEHFGMTSSDQAIPLSYINYRRAWKTSRFMTFLGHVALERLNCASSSYNGSFVRILLNSVPTPVPGCMNGPSGSCSLKKYQDYVKHRYELFDDFSKACEIRKKDVADVLKFFSKRKDL